MKREIKFRGKDIENANQWRYGSLIQYPNGDCVIVEFDKDGNELSYDVDPDTVGRFTGYKDDEYIEIYEGDVLKCYDGVEEYITKVRDEGGALIIDVNCLDYDYSAIGWALELEIQEFKVIGNIHDNSELLCEK